MKKRLSRLSFFQLLLSVNLMLLLTLPACGPAPTAPEPSLGFSSFIATPPEALPNDEVTVTWEYSNPRKLKSQWIEIISLTIGGRLLRTVEGRPIDALSGEVESAFSSNPVLPLSRRATSFTFNGPVTVVVGAQAEDGTVMKTASDLKLKGAFVKVDVRTVNNNRSFPNVLEATQGRSDKDVATIDFPVFFATYDHTDNPRVAPNHKIDYFSTLNLSFMAAAPFFARSLSPNANQRFGIRMGGEFPALEPDYLSSNDAIDASQSERFQFLEPEFQYADVLLYAGKIKYDGEVLVSKTPTGEYTSRTGSLSFEPLFFEIDFRSEKSGGALHTADMHLGNVSQGFVASAYWSPTPGRALNATVLGADNYDVPNPGGSGTFKGLLTSPSDTVSLARIGFQCDNLPNVNGVPSTNAYLDVRKASWQNVPIYSDRDLSGMPLSPRP